MPFMLIHPAAALPFYRRLGRYGVLSALIIGSMTPDMHYFLPFAVDRASTHSVSGLVWFCWPMGLALYLLYHRLLKQPLVLLLPQAAASRINPWLNPGRLPRATWNAVSLSLLVGAATHITWDAFTHQHEPVVDALPVLSSIWFTLGNYPLAGYMVLQQASNILGFALLGGWSWRWLRTHSAQAAVLVEPALSPVQRRLILSGMLIVSVVVTVWHITPPANTGLQALHHTFKQATLAMMSSGALVLLGYSLLWHMWTRWRSVFS